MKRLLAILLLCTPVWAQSNSPVIVTVKLGTVQKIWQFILGSPTTITSFLCTQPADAQSPAAGTTVLMPGDSSTCTVTIVQGAGILASATQISIAVPAPLAISADPNAASGITVNGSVLSIPWGSTVGTFLVTYPVQGNPVAALQVWPVDWWVSGGGGPPGYYAELLVPCCARADLCGLPADQVDQEACQAGVN